MGVGALLLVAYLVILGFGIVVTPGMNIIPPVWQFVLFFGSLAIGAALGALGGAWIVHNSGREGVRFGLLTLSLVPVVGTAVSVICGVLEVYWWLGRMMKSRQVTPPCAPGER
jgi:hypothetical protein